MTEDAPTNGANHKPTTMAGFIQLASLVLMALALIGYIYGSRQNLQDASAQSRHDNQMETAQSGDAHAAVFQGDLRVRGDRPNKNYESELASLLLNQTSTPGGDRGNTVADRARLRAFDGAPPVVPHPIHQRDTANCMSCHEKGRWIGSIFARPMSHDPWPACTMCHAEVRKADLRVWDENWFKGLQAEAGNRYVGGAPPMIPHTRLQIEKTRANCGACHGEHAWAGIRYSNNDAHRVPDSSKAEHAEKGFINKRCFQCHVVESDR